MSTSFRYRWKLALYVSYYAIQNKLRAGNAPRLAISILFICTGGLIYYTPIWNYIDAICEKSTDYNAFSMLFEGVQPAISNKTDIFNKKTFVEACNNKNLPTTQAYKSAKEIPKEGNVWLKPNKGRMGRGHQKLKVKDFHILLKQSKTLFDDYSVQEVLENVEWIKRLQSHKHLSTFRIDTYSFKGSKPKIINKYLLKVGAMGSICDNEHKPGRKLYYFTANGTLESSYESPTGYIADKIQIDNPIIDEPDIYKAFKIMKEMVIKAHKELVPNILSVGWDIAIVKGRNNNNVNEKWEVKLIEPNLCSATADVECVRENREEHLNWMLEQKNSKNKKE